MLRSIKDSAKPDIDEFKRQKEHEYQVQYEALKKKINEGNGDKDGAKQEAVTMDVIEKDYNQNKERVIDLLVSNVLSVNIEIPKVVKGAYWEYAYL